MNEANFYARTTGACADTLTLNLGLRYEYVDGAERGRAAGSTTSSAPTPTTSSRGSASPDAPAWAAGCSGG